MVTARNSDITLLSPGEIIFTEKPLIVRTILGSCIAVTVWHPHLKVGGICHFLIANHQQEHKAKVQNYRYGDCALTFLMKEMSQYAPLNEFELRLFGGANMYSSRSKPTVGEKNAHFTKQWAKSYQLKFKQIEILGNVSRSIIFDLATGNVELQQYQQNKVEHNDH
ncbi:chemotaxis protein CheD [Litorilituus lipolyticus]|uniref:Probable chemoreceptor glutamine deamidase CheD n=1 Tax=Litorilituus lipolyticus TaxID=2491017 RepID=A0A502L849_9GAMM|nr:chemotaxis protein CheD [Litorilituus lipolyticus]TPH19264.1 hypothetical protein EPA86_00630 [Litorilituus lipolyticus]